MSLILALPTKQRVSHSVTAAAVALAMSAFVARAGYASITTTIAENTFEQVNRANLTEPLLTIGEPIFGNIVIASFLTTTESVARDETAVSVIVPQETTLDSVASSRSRVTLIDATGEAGICAASAAASHTQNRLVNYSTPASIVMDSGTTSIFRFRRLEPNMLALSVASPVSPQSYRGVRQSLVTGVVKPFAEQGSLHYIIRTIAFKEATIFTADHWQMRMTKQEATMNMAMVKRTVATDIKDVTITMTTETDTIRI